jgi:hypothetical protein
MAPFHTPSDPGSDSLTFGSGDAVRLACPDANNNLLLIPNSPLTVYEVIAFCIKGEVYECRIYIPLWWNLITIFSEVR